MTDTNSTVDASPSDAGTASRDAGADTDQRDGGTDSAHDAGRRLITEPTLGIVYNGPASAPLFAGRYRQVVYRFATATMRNLIASGLTFRIETVDGRSLVSSRGNPLVRNLQLVNWMSGGVVSVMTEIPRTPGIQSVTLRFPRAFQIPAGEGDFAIALDIPYLLDEGQAGTRIRVTVGDDRHFFTDGSIETVEGDVLAPEAIANNITIPGNVHTVHRPSAYVALGSGPTMRTTVGHAVNVRSIELPVSAGVASDLRHTGRFRVYGRGNTGSGFRFQDFRHVVSSCRLVDGAEVVSTEARTPDMNGMMDFVIRPDRIVRRGITVGYAAECTMDSVIGPGDQFALGLMGPGDIGFADSEGPSPDVFIDPRVVNQLTGTPSVIINVVRSGAFTITYDGVSGAREITPERDTWYVGANYRASTTIKAQSTDHVAVQWIGPSACIQTLGVASMGRLLGQNVPRAGTSGAVDVTLTTPLFVSGGSTAPLQVWVQLAPVSEACPAGTNITVGLASNLTMVEWDESYRGRYNVRVRGELSGERIPPEGMPQLGEPLIIR